MPTEKKTRKRSYRRRRPARTRRSFNRRRGLVNLGKSIVPRAQIAKLAYCDNDFSLTSTSGIFDRDSYSLIGLYDVDLTGTGHQPLGFDQMMTLYDHYQVLGVKYTITVTHADGDCCVGIQFSDRQTPSVTGISTLQENPNYLYKYLSMDTANQMPVVLTKKVGLARFFGVPKSGFNGETKYTGTSTANPSETAACHVFVHALNGATVNIRYSLRAEFITKFTEPKSLSGS